MMTRLQPKQDSIRLQVLHNHWNPVFSTVFYGRSVPDIYPCRVYTFSTTHLLTEALEWKYYPTDAKMPYNWRDLCYDDSAWRTDRLVYSINQGEILYLRQHVNVHSHSHHSHH